ncbi:hypothetical protein [Burkholderia sp. Bp8963]|uniref:hypothetical protein n=1 Tax=Burkholderia sp. Bp8963 TaxID=2184547 RepID=UPI000F5AC354|nr:hypothetical protein [Burkholderia sp. Bp8963]
MKWNWPNGQSSGALLRGRVNECRRVCSAATPHAACRDACGASCGRAHGAGCATVDGRARVAGSVAAGGFARRDGYRIALFAQRSDRRCRHIVIEAQLMQREVILINRSRHRQATRVIRNVVEPLPDYAMRLLGRKMSKSVLVMPMGVDRQTARMRRMTGGCNAKRPAVLRMLRPNSRPLPASAPKHPHRSIRMHP